MCKTMVKSCKNYVFTYFEILSYASNMLFYTPVTLIGLTVLVYILTLLSFVCLRFCYDDLDYASCLYSYASLTISSVYTIIMLPQ